MLVTLSKPPQQHLCFLLYSLTCAAGTAFSIPDQQAEAGAVFSQGVSGKWKCFHGKPTRTQKSEPLQTHLVKVEARRNLNYYNSFN